MVHRVMGRRIRRRRFRGKKDCSSSCYLNDLVFSYAERAARIVRKAAFNEADAGRHTLTIITIRSVPRFGPWFIFAISASARVDRHINREYIFGRRRPTWRRASKR